MRICFVRLSALGDVVMCLPLLRTLQKNFPNAEITWIVGEAVYPLLEGLSQVKLICMPKIFSPRDLLVARKILKPHAFDYFLATQASLSAHLFYPFIAAKKKIGYDSFRSKDGHRFFVDERISFHKEHSVEGYLRFAKTIGAKEPFFDIELPLGEEVVFKGPKSPYFVINPCSSKLLKDWDPKNYSVVIQEVEKRHHLIPVLIGSKKDHPICEELAVTARGINLCGKTSVKELTLLLKQAVFLLSGDTGPMHIASSLNIPTVALFGPTSSLLTGPYFSREYVIDKHEEVLQRYGTAKQRALGWNVRVYHKDAMKLITPEEVLEKISRLF